MKIFKRLAIISFILIAFCFAFKGWIYRHLVTYKTIERRTSYPVNSPNLEKLISENSGFQETNLKEIVKTSLSLTSKSLRFTDGNNANDPNRLVESRDANCIGYAAFMSTVCNQMLKESNLSNEWVATPQIGQLYLLGKNIHPYFKSAFFRDHDFVIIRNLTSGEEIGVDPSLHDYTGIGYITLKN